MEGTTAARIATARALQRIRFKAALHPFRSEKVQPQNLFHNLLGSLASGGNAEVGKAVEGNPLLEEMAKARRVTEQRPCLDPFRAPKQFFERTIQPYGRPAALADEINIRRLDKRPATERDDAGLAL